MAEIKNMSLSLGRNESVCTAIKRVTHRRIDYVVKLLDRRSDAGAGQGIHEARKQLKQLRALLRLIDHEIGRKRRSRADSRVREVTRSLSPLRDTTVLLATLQGLHRRGAIPSGSFATMRSDLRIRLKRTRDQVLASPRKRKWLAKCLLATRRQVARWPPIHRGWKAIGPGLRQAYRAGSAAALALDGSDEAFHAARKRAKDLLYTMEFLRQVQRRSMPAKIAAARRLTDCLGNDRDLALLMRALGSELRGRLRPAELKRLTTTVARLRRSLQLEARALAQALYAQTEDAFVGLIHSYWRKWRDRSKAIRAEPGTGSRVPRSPAALSK
jgi:CHAD domain-containing protein